MASTEKNKAKLTPLVGPLWLLDSQKGDWHDS